MPEYWQLIRAARYLGVAPWELASRPAHWMSWALTVQSAEIGAENEMRKHPELYGDGGALGSGTPESD